jgi:hypothetical protein
MPDPASHGSAVPEKAIPMTGELPSLLSRTLRRDLLRIASQLEERKKSQLDCYRESYDLIANAWLDAKGKLDEADLTEGIPGLLFTAALEFKWISLPERKQVQGRVIYYAWVTGKPVYDRTSIEIPETELTENVGGFRVTPKLKSDFLGGIRGRIHHWEAQSLSGPDAAASEAGKWGAGLGGRGNVGAGVEPGTHGGTDLGVQKSKSTESGCAGQIDHQDCAGMANLVVSIERERVAGRGRRADVRRNHAIAGIVGRFGAGWKTETYAVCDALDEANTPLPNSKKWKRKNCRSWRDVLSKDREGLVKAIEHRLQWTAKHPQPESNTDLPA